MIWTWCQSYVKVKQTLLFMDGKYNLEVISVA